MDKPTAAILLTLLVHVLGIGALFWLAFDGSMDWRSWWPRDESGGGGGERPADEPQSPRGGFPRPMVFDHVCPDDAEPADIRLRTEHERLRRRPARRPEHAPEPVRRRESV